MSEQAARSEQQDSLFARADLLWQELNQLLDARPHAELLAPRLVGDWSGKDLIAHLGRWKEAAIEVIEDHLAGRDPVDYDDFEPWNQQWAARDAALTLDQARRYAGSAHDRLQRLARSVPAERWDATVQGWFKGSSVNHLQDHIEALKVRARE